MAAGENVSGTADETMPNIVDPEVYATSGYPHDVWTRLRREDPVHWWSKTQGIPFWAVTRHDDITTISKRPETFASGPRLTISHLPERQMSEFPPTLIQLDPPKHGAYRQLVSRRFTPGALRRMHHDIERIGAEIVDSLVGWRPPPLRLPAAPRTPSWKSPLSPRRPPTSKRPTPIGRSGMSTVRASYPRWKRGLAYRLPSPRSRRSSTIR